MRKLLILLLLTASAFAQRGASLGTYKGPVDAQGCPLPDVNNLYLCIYETSEVKVSSYGKPYQDPVNMLTSGTPGPQGLPGTAATVQVGTVTTGVAGTPATVKNVGTTSAAVLNFTIPQGLIGAQGPAFTGGACRMKTTGATDVNGFTPIQITCP